LETRLNFRAEVIEMISNEVVTVFFTNTGKAVVSPPIQALIKCANGLAMFLCDISSFDGNLKTLRVSRTTVPTGERDKLFGLLVLAKERPGVSIRPIELGDSFSLDMVLPKREADAPVEISFQSDVGVADLEGLVDANDDDFGGFDATPETSPDAAPVTAAVAAPATAPVTAKKRGGASSGRGTGRLFFVDLSRYTLRAMPGVDLTPNSSVVTVRHAIGMLTVEYVLSVKSKSNWIPPSVPANIEKYASARSVYPCIAKAWATVVKTMMKAQETYRDRDADASAVISAGRLESNRTMDLFDSVVTSTMNDALVVKFVNGVRV
jgi:hypothetical protein